MKLDKNTCALLVVDWQTNLLPHLEEGVQALEMSTRLCQVAKHFGLPTFVSEQAPTKLGKTVDRLAPYLLGCPRYSKTHFSCFGDENIRRAIEASECHQIILCGAETHICIALTARDLVEAGYQVALCTDGCCSRSKAQHLAALDTLTSLGVWVMPFDTLAYDLMGQAGTADFKALLPLFK